MDTFAWLPFNGSTLWNDIITVPLDNAALSNFKFTSFEAPSISFDTFGVPRTGAGEIVCCNNGSGQENFFKCEDDCSKDPKFGADVHSERRLGHEVNVDGVAPKLLLDVGNPKVNNGKGRLADLEDSSDDTYNPEHDPDIKDSKVKHAHIVMPHQGFKGVMGSGPGGRLTPKEKDIMIYGPRPPPVESMLGYKSLNGGNNLPTIYNGKRPMPRPSFSMVTRKSKPIFMRIGKISLQELDQRKMHMY